MTYGKSVAYKKRNMRRLGERYEKKAGEYLAECGYEILEYNFRCRMGEIDIIAKDGEYLVFCEVKYRTGKRMGEPSEAVNIRKQETISKCAAYYLTWRRLPELPCRFDVVSIEGEKVTLIKNAFESII